MQTEAVGYISGRSEVLYSAVLPAGTPGGTALDPRRRPAVAGRGDWPLDRRACCRKEVAVFWPVIVRAVRPLRPRGVRRLSGSGGSGESICRCSLVTAVAGASAWPSSCWSRILTAEIIWRFAPVEIVVAFRYFTAAARAGRPIDLSSGGRCQAPDRSGVPGWRSRGWLRGSRSRSACAASTVWPRSACSGSSLLLVPSCGAGHAGSRRADGRASRLSRRGGLVSCGRDHRRARCGRFSTRARLRSGVLLQVSAGGLADRAGRDDRAAQRGVVRSGAAVAGCGRRRRRTSGCRT